MKNIIVTFILILFAICIFLYAFGLYDFGIKNNDFGFHKISLTPKEVSQNIDEKGTRTSIELIYPAFKNFENKKTLFGRKVKFETDAETGDRYVVYMNLGSDVHIADATCFLVDAGGHISQTGTFPNPADSYNGYMDVYPRTCEGLR